MLPAVSSNNLPPVDLRSFLPPPAQDTPWLFSASLKKRLKDQAGTYPLYNMCEIIQQDPEWEFILRYFEDQCPRNCSIARVYCIDNPMQIKRFEAGIAQQEVEGQNPLYAPRWKNPNPCSLRKKTIERWYELSDPYTSLTTVLDATTHTYIPATHTRVMPLWHGTKKSASNVLCNSICSTGFTIIGKHNSGGDTTDAGYFGSGIYFTTSARYAADFYGKLQVSGSLPDGILFLSWVSMREPYPVVSYQQGKGEPQDMRILKAKHAYAHHNAHYIPVVSTRPENPNCSVYYPCRDTETPVWDEIVVFNSYQTLPRFWIQLQIGLHAPLTVATVNHLVQYLLELLRQDSVQQDFTLPKPLRHKLHHLIDLNLGDPLTQEDQEFYNCSYKLLDNVGTVRNVFKRQLHILYANISFPLDIDSSLQEALSKLDQVDQDKQYLNLLSGQVRLLQAFRNHYAKIFREDHSYEIGATYESHTYSTELLPTTFDALRLLKDYLTRYNIQDTKLSNALELIISLEHSSSYDQHSALAKALDATIKEMNEKISRECISTECSDGIKELENLRKNDVLPSDQNSNCIVS
jgi:hypothetical protein